jgi:hypothetical protein
VQELDNDASRLLASLAPRQVDSSPDDAADNPRLDGGGVAQQL